MRFLRVECDGCERVGWRRDASDNEGVVEETERLTNKLKETESKVRGERTARRRNMNSEVSRA